MRLKTLIAPMIFALASLAAACGTKQEAAIEKPPVLQGARIERVAKTTVDDYYEAVGTVRSATTSVLSARITGSVVALRVREGDRVRAGQALVEIDNREANAQLQKARAGQREAEDALEEVDRSIRAAESAKAAADAQKQLARTTFNRYKELLERRSVSPQEFDEVQARNRVAEAEADRSDKMLQTLGARRSQALARIDQAKADITSAQVYAGYATVVSPINGVVTARQTDVGQTATPGAPLLTVEDDSRYRLEAAVEESRIGSVRLGDNIKVLLDAVGGTELEGKIDEIVPTADPSSRSFTMKVSLPAEAIKLGVKSGMYGKARFVVGRKEAILVPRSAVVERGQLISVFVVDQSGFARLRLIKTGKNYGDNVEVLSGLTDGEEILASGTELAGDGSRVR